MKLPEFDPLDRETRQRVRVAGGMLARPRMDAAMSRRVRKVLSAGRWRPVPRIPALSGVAALMTHNAIKAGFGAERLFAEPVSDALFARLALNDHLRRSEIGKVLHAFGRAGCDRAMLVKGAALAPFWPSPALREMEDADLVVASADAAKACGALEGLGWRRTDVGWSHPCGLHLDLSVPKTPLALRMFDNAEPHSEWRGIAALPRPADHVVLIAVHAARNRGLRIWRDLCDATVLLEGGEGVRSGARAVAAEFGRTLELEAFLAAYDRLMRFRGGSRTDGDAKALAALYLAMACDPVSVFGFNALSSTLVTPGEFLGGIARTIAGAKSPAGERDPAFGELPGRGSFARQWIKLRWIARLASTGRLAHYRRLVARGRRAFAAGKVFSDADRP